MGATATDRLRQLTPRDSTIQFREADTDRYGRTVAEVYVGGQNVNLQMVQEGYAVVYTQFLSSCPETGSALQAAAECVNKNETKNKKKLVWNRWAVRSRHRWIDPNGSGHNRWAWRVMDKALRMGEISGG